MPAWLADVIGQIESQLERDRQLEDLAVRSGADADAAPACRSIIEGVRRSEAVWTRLELHTQQAIPVYLAAQEAQRFQPRGLSATLDLQAGLLDAALVAAADIVEQLGAVLLGGLSRPHPPPQWGVDDLLKVLLRPPVSWERPPPDVDEPGELGESIGDSIPDDVAAGAAAVLATALSAPRRLSELLADARLLAGDVGEPDLLLDIVWGAAHYCFVAFGDIDPDTLPRRADLAAAASQLIAVDDGTPLVDPPFAGRDLLVVTPVGLELADAAADLAAAAGATNDVLAPAVAGGKGGDPHS